MLHACYFKLLIYACFEKVENVIKTLEIKGRKNKT